MDVKDGLAPEEFMFFDGKEGALALYERLRAAVLTEIDARRKSTRSCSAGSRNRPFSRAERWKCAKFSVQNGFPHIDG